MHKIKECDVSVMNVDYSFIHQSVTTAGEKFHREGSFYTLYTGKKHVLTEITITSLSFLFTMFFKFSLSTTFPYLLLIFLKINCFEIQFKKSKQKTTPPPLMEMSGSTSEFPPKGVFDGGLVSYYRSNESVFARLVIKRCIMLYCMFNVYLSLIVNIIGLR